MAVLETLTRLAKKLDEAQHPLARFDRYAEGKAGLALATEKFRTSFDGRLAGLTANYCGLVVQAVAERLAVVGFRLGGQEETDAAAWEVWQRNELDGESQLAHVDALTLGRSYVAVWADEQGRARVTVESPKQVYVEHHPGGRHRTAAIKSWQEGNEAFATVYTADEIHRFASRSSPGIVPTSWQRRGEVIPNTLGTVPIVPIINRQRTLDFAGTSELAPVIPLQDLLNRLLADLVVAAEYVSLPRRWVTGMEIETDPETNAPIEPFSATGRLWQAEGEGAKFGSFQEASLDGILAAIEMAVQHIASISGIPPHFILSPASRGGPSSAESIKSAEASLVQKVKRRQVSFGAAWEEVIRLALAIEQGAPPAGSESAETVWGDAETRSLAQSADAALKRKEVGVPLPQLWEDLGYSPTQVARFREMIREQAMDAATLDLAGLLGAN